MKIIFLDRDGVINRYPGDKKYVTSWQEFRFLPRAKKAIRLLTKAGYKIFIISNQAGVSKKIYSKKILDNITAKMIKEINRAKGKVEKVFYCLHRDEDNCNCRKPKIGLIKRAFNAFKLKTSLIKSKIYIIGDSVRDIKTGRRAGLKTILVFSGKEKIKDKKSWEVQPDFIAKDLYSAIKKIVLNSKIKP